MRAVDVGVIGAGPAGLCAAIAAAEAGASVTVVDRQAAAGGQLVKQTHRFFGSREERAGTRGTALAKELAAKTVGLGVEVVLEAEVLGCYDDGVVLFERSHRVHKLKPSRLILAAGAAERMLPFPGNDLPGVYGAGAVQTLMNVYGVRPGRRAVMVGAGNIGLIVGYQLIQAGVDVVAVVEAAPVIGGYLVHAAKLRRSGVPILTGHTVTRALGDGQVDRVEVAAVGDGWAPIPGTERQFQADVLCLAVGLSPLVELHCQLGCGTRHVPELGGHVPVRDARLQTTRAGVFVAGDAAGVEEASVAMVEGRLAGLSAAADLGYTATYSQQAAECRAALRRLRAGPLADKVRRGLQTLGGWAEDA